MNQRSTSYVLATRLDVPFEEADRRVREALGREGFGVLTEIDVAATLAKKLDVEWPPHEILGACAPALAHQALRAEPTIGALLPCNVVVRRPSDEEVTIVEAIDPVVQLGVADNPALAPLAAEVRERMARVMDALASP